MKNTPNGKLPMKTQENVDVSYSRDWIFRAMVMPAPEQHGAAHDNRGFTLVELLMVIAIIGVLSLMVIPQYSNLQNKVKSARCKSEIRTVEKNIIAYNLEKGSFPPTGSLGLATTTLTDPWGRAYQYYNIQTGGVGGPYTEWDVSTTINHDFDLYSMGVNGLGTYTLSDADCMDDIIRSADGLIVEEAKDY
jgi:general secretion pathway protein G